MKIGKILILCTITGLIAVPTVSTEKLYLQNPKSKVILDSMKKITLLVLLQRSLLLHKNYFLLYLTQSISQGQTITNNVNVGSGVNYLEVDLNWRDTSDSLTLSAYTPSGSKLGTYRDNSDGSVNDRIHINIDHSQGYVQQGT